MPHGLRYTEWAVQALAPLGLDLRQMVHICVLIFSHTKGLANDIAAESEQQQQDTGLTADEFMSTRAGDMAALNTPEKLPMLSALVRSDDFDLDVDELFEFGLQRLLDGREGWLAARGRRRFGR